MTLEKLELELKLKRIYIQTTHVIDIIMNNYNNSLLAPDPLKTISRFFILKLINTNILQNYHWFIYQNANIHIYSIDIKLKTFNIMFIFNIYIYKYDVNCL